MALFDKIKIFYDGVQIDKYGLLPCISGFTTNTSIMKSGGITSYKSFIEANQSIIGDRPISMQLFEDDDELAMVQAQDIASLGENVYVKVPIVKSTGESNIPLIRRLIKHGVKLNITTVFTEDQIDDIYEAIKDVCVPVIVSIFAGRISDTCRNPVPIIRYATTLYAPLQHAEVLWAGCKETLSIQHAIDCNCHIITVPEPILDRMGRVGRDLTESAVETSAAFRADAMKGGLRVL